jgi:hypothetical protein
VEIPGDQTGDVGDVQGELHSWFEMDRRDSNRGGGK